MKQYLRTFVSYQQDDWPSWLPVAEFVSNNTMSEATKVTPFFVNKGYHPWMSFEKLSATRVPQELKTDEFTTHIKELEKFLKTEMQFTQANYETATNRHRIPASSYQVENQVWLSTKNLQTKRLCQELNMRWAGSFKVKQVINPYAYELDLPRAYGVHSVFHVNLMNPVVTDPLEGHWQEPSSLILINREEKWLMKEILDAQKIRRSLNYLIKWVEFNNLTWQPAADITHSSELLQEFYERFLIKSH